VPKKQKAEGLLGDVPRLWEREWKGMPEFIQRDMEPRKTIRVHFRSKKDMRDFSKLIGHPITMMTKFVWWPPAKKFKYGTMRYVERREDKS